MGSVVGLAPAGHIHRRIDRELALVGPHHLKQELQLVASLSALNDIQPKDDRRPQLCAGESGMLQGPLPIRRCSSCSSRVDRAGRLIEGVHIRRCQEREECGQRGLVEGTSHHEVITPASGSHIGSVPSHSSLHILNALRTGLAASHLPRRRTRRRGRLPAGIRTAILQVL